MEIRVLQEIGTLRSEDVTAVNRKRQVQVENSSQNRKWAYKNSSENYYGYKIASNYQIYVQK